MGEVQVNIPSQWDIRLTPIGELVPNPKNRNIHSEAQIERLSLLIEHYGWRLPIIVSKLSGHVVSGHGRLLAAKKLKLKEVPVSYQDFKNEDEERAFAISDNAIAAWAELDLKGINMDLEELGPFDIELLAIKDFLVDPYEHFQPGSEEDQSRLDKTQILECPRCGESFEKSEAKVVG